MISARAHGHADIGRREAGGVIDPVTNHGHAFLSAVFEFLNGRYLVFRPQPRTDLVHPGRSAHRDGRSLPVAGQHHGVYAAGP